MNKPNTIPIIKVYAGFVGVSDLYSFPAFFFFKVPILVGLCTFKVFKIEHVES